MPIIKLNNSIIRLNNSIIFNKDKEPNIVVIGGKSYPTVTIGTQTWTAVNLDFTWSGLPVDTGSWGNKDTPVANYYQYDKATYGWDGLRYGLLYNGAAAMYLENHKAELIPGWHIPTMEEFNTLANYLGGTSVAGKVLKSTTGWSDNKNGTNDTGFNGFPAGIRYISLGFGNLGSSAKFLGRENAYAAGRYASLQLQTNNAVVISDSADAQLFMSIRLIKDI